MLENNRLMRMHQKMIEFTFEVKWVEGKTHYIADALSRALVFAPEEEFTIDYYRTAWQKPLLKIAKH